MCSSRKFRKVMALFLAMIMLFGTFATGVSAAETGGQTGEGGSPTWSGDPYTGSWMTTKLSSGVRYSLVKIKKSAIATQIDSFDDYYTIGSIDVLSDDLYKDLYSTYAAYSPYYWITNTKLKYTDENVYGGTGIQYRRLNALDYEVGYMNDSFDFFTNMTTYKWSGTDATGKTVSTNDADLFHCPDTLTTSTGANQFSGAAGAFLSLWIAAGLLLDLLGCCADSDSCEALSHNLQLAVSFFNGIFQQPVIVLCCRRPSIL